MLITSIIETRDPVSPFMFPGNKPDQPLREIKKFWQIAMLRVGLTNYRRHDNRHTYASHLVSSGLSLEIVGQLLGHTTATTTKRYADLADDPLRDHGSLRIKDCSPSERQISVRNLQVGLATGAILPALAGILTSSEIYADIQA
jgi:hypothetical protein